MTSPVSTSQLEPSPVTPFHAKRPAQVPSKAYLRTASGRAFAFDRILPAQVHWRDVAAQLAKINRFAGATVVPYSVAQHSVLVAEIVSTRWPRHDTAPLYALLHDAHEMITGDIPAPVIDWLHKVTGAPSVKTLQMLVDESVIAAAGLPWPVPADVAAAIGQADIVARHAEARHLLADPQRGVPPWPDLPGGIQPWPKPVKALVWDKAETLFVDRLRVCAIRAGKPLDV